MTDIYDRAVWQLFATSSGSEEATDPTQVLTDGVKLVFSWIILMPIAVIVSGKLITQLLKIPGQRGQFFQIRIPYLISLRAQNDEAILGFMVFIATLAMTGFIAGGAVYRLFSAAFGIDPGQFNSLCIVSSFISVIFSGVMLMLTRCVGNIRRRSDPVIREYNRTIDELASQMPQAADAPIDGGDGRDD